MERIVVSDTNIFIDLFSVGLLDEFFSLGFDVHTTDFIIGELRVAEQRAAVLSFAGLTIKSFDTYETAELVSFYLGRHKLSNVSLPDCSVLMYAKANGYTLLTGDGQLRHMATADNVEVRGVLYIFDKLVEDGLLPPRTAHDKLELLSKLNVRLPAKEIEKRLNLWKSL